MLCIHTSADPTTDKQIQLSSVVYFQIQCHIAQLYDTDKFSILYQG